MVITGEVVLGWAAGLIVLSGALGVIGRYVLRPAYMIMQRANEFFDDWFGVPERNGVPARKGVMSRLSEVEVTKVDRAELAGLVEMIAAKAEREEVLALRQALDDHIRQMDQSSS